MARKEDVPLPWESIVVHGSGQDKFQFRMPSSRFDEQLAHAGLPITRVRSQITEVAPVTVVRREWFVTIGIHATIERRRAAGAQAPLQLMQRAATGIAEDEIEIRQATGPNVVHRLSAFEPAQ